MLSIEFKRLPFDTIYQRLLKGEKNENGEVTYQGIPDTKFFDKRFDVVPYSFEPIAFVIRSSNTDRVLKLKIQNSTPSLKLRPAKELSVYMLNEEQTVLLDINEGHNYIVIEDTVTRETAFTVVNARRYATLLWVSAQEIYNKIQSKIDEQEDAIFSRYATRLVEPLVAKIYGLLPSTKSLQMLALRLITKVYTTKASTDVGVSDMSAALTLNHPYFSTPDRTSRELDPVRFPLESYQEFFSSKLAHLWLPNFSIVRWKAFMTYMNNLKGVIIVDINEDEIVIQTESGDTERHIFDFENDSDFFSKRKFVVDFVGTAKSKLRMDFIAPGYTFDMIVNEDKPLGNSRPNFDMGVPLDSGLAFDAEEFDRNHDGYVGMSLVDRNDGALGYDSTRSPSGTSTIEKLVYSNGYYVKAVDIDHTITSCTLNGPISWSLDSYATSYDGGTFLGPLLDLDAGTFGTPTLDFDSGTF